MFHSQKVPANRSRKKVNKKKFTDKSVRIIKHFQPKFINHNVFVDHERVPEIRDDVENASDIENCESHYENRSSKSIRYSFINKKRTNNNNNNTFVNVDVITSNNMPHKYSVGNQLKSKSLIESRVSTFADVNKGNLKAKSTVEFQSNHSEKYFYAIDNDSLDLVNRTPILNTPIKDNPLDMVKKEIIVNRIEGFKSFPSCSERKQKLVKLRRELGLLLNTPHKEDIKTQICEYENMKLSSNPENVIVYDVYDTKCMKNLKEITVPNRHTGAGQIEEIVSCKLYTFNKY